MSRLEISSFVWVDYGWRWACTCPGGRNKGEGKKALRSISMAPADSADVKNNLMTMQPKQHTTPSYRPGSLIQRSLLLCTHVSSFARTAAIATDLFPCSGPSCCLAIQTYAQLLLTRAQRRSLACLAFCTASMPCRGRTGWKCRGGHLPKM